MNIAIVVNGEFVWAVVGSRTEADAVITGIATSNRWWKQKDNHELISMQATERALTSPLDRMWLCTWVPGCQGWDCVPLQPHRHSEGVRYNREDMQQAYVKAPTAALAIEGAKFLLMEKGKDK